MFVKQKVLWRWRRPKCTKSSNVYVRCVSVVVLINYLLLMWTLYLTSFVLVNARRYVISIISINSIHASCLKMKTVKNYVARNRTFVHKATRKVITRYPIPNTKRSTRVDVKTNRFGRLTAWYSTNGTYLSTGGCARDANIVTFATCARMQRRRRFVIVRWMIDVIYF